MTSAKAFLFLVVAAISFSCGNNEDAAGNSENLTTTTGNNNAAPTPDSVTAELVADGFVSPLYATQPKDDNRLFVVDQTGQIYIVKNGQRIEQPFLNIEDKIVELKPEHEERGLLGLAFHPDYKNNGRFFIYYSAPLQPSAPKGWDHTTHVAEYKVSASNPDMADPASERILLRINQPQYNHNAGTVAFGQDGYLYISVGDGGGAGDKDMGHVPDWYNRNEGGNGQDVKQNLLGSILRIDVNGNSPYGIPADNPFAGRGIGMDEVYAFGLRNPYRFTFAHDGALIAADAGQALFEEIDVITRGGNYGWNVKEGRHCFNASNFDQPLDTCPSVDSMGNPLIDPVIEFKNSKSFPDSGLGIVSVGGIVYNASTIPGLKDKYLFGVWTQHHGKSDGAVFAAERTGNYWPYKKLWFKNSSNNELGHYVLGFGMGNNAEAYILTSDEEGPRARSGKVFHLK